MILLKKVMVNKIRSFSDWTVLYEGKDNTGNKAKEALSTLNCGLLLIKLITPPIASVPYCTEPVPLATSILLMV